VLAISLVHAQAAPNFSGTWVSVTPEAGQLMSVTQDAQTLTFGPPDGVQQVVRLDGMESRNVFQTDDGGRGMAVSRATWSGRQLTVVSTVLLTETETTDQTVRWSLDRQGQLSLEVSQKGAEPKKTVYKRQR
jgi:hypothetical protein